MSQYDIEEFFAKKQAMQAAKMATVQNEGKWAGGGQYSKDLRADCYIYQNQMVTVTSKVVIDSNTDRLGPIVGYIPSTDLKYSSPSASVDIILKQREADYAGKNSAAHYWGYKATWVPLWRTAIRINDKDYVAAAFSFGEDVLEVVFAAQAGGALARVGKGTAPTLENVNG